MSPIETVREVAAVEGTPEISIDFSPHKEAFQYNVGETTYTPTNTYYAWVGETNVFTATIVFANTGKQWAVGYKWDFGDGSVGYDNPSTHAYASPSNYLQVSLTVTDNKGQEWRSRKAMYLKKALGLFPSETLYPSETLFPAE